MKRDPAKLCSREFDILVIGGGIHGALAAWDAVLRGLSVALIERGDFGSATSQNSLKIIHGGLRYLQDGNLSRIRIMARERTTWMRIAPHLVHPLTCLMPTQQKISRSRLALSTALALNDLLSFDRNRSTDSQKHIPGGKVISKQELSRLLPGYDVDSLTGAAIWHDAQIYNTERLLLEFILSSVEEGAEAANYVEAVGFLRQENHIRGVHARDILTGELFDIRAKIVINCAGAWVEELLEQMDTRSGYATSIAMNLIVDRVWPRLAAGLPSRPEDGRPAQIMFFVPWRNKTMIGTWHLPWNNSPDEFKMTGTVVRRFIDEINSAHPALKLSMDKVHHVTWGFLPVNSEEAHRQPVKLTRDGVVVDHQKKDGFTGLISVLGVKYTTARTVAEQAVDLAVEKLSVKAAKCQTHLKPVHGGQIEYFKAFLNQAIAKAPRHFNEEIVEHLVYTHGSEYRHLVKEMVDQPEMRLRLDPHQPVMVAEVLHAVRYEMAITLLDVIQRRTELGSAGLPSAGVLQKCAELMACELGWSFERQQQEIASVVQAYPLKAMERVTA